MKTLFSLLIDMTISLGGVAIFPTYITYIMSLSVIALLPPLSPCIQWVLLLTPIQLIHRYQNDLHEGKPLPTLQALIINIIVAFPIGFGLHKLFGAWGSLPLPFLNSGSMNLSSLKADFFILPITLTCFLYGLYEDIMKARGVEKVTLSRPIKFLLLGAGVFLCQGLVYGWDLYKLAFDTTIIVAFITAYTMTDKVSGLAGSVSLCALVSGFVCVITARSTVFTPCLVVAPLGHFLCYTWPKSFMGKSGSLMVGALIGQMYILSGYSNLYLLCSIVPILTLAYTLIRSLLSKLGVSNKLMPRFEEIADIQVLLFLTAVSSIAGHFMQGQNNRPAIQNQQDRVSIAPESEASK